MMRVVWLSVFILPVMLTGFNSPASERGTAVLAHNPFSKPMTITAPAPSVVKQLQPVEEFVELQLTATLVSTSAPLVIVEGEMLGIGEEIEGYRLISVEEGRAVFDKKGERHAFELVGSGVDIE